VSWPPGALALLAVAGWADVISAVFRNTIIQLAVPDALRGRLSGLQIAVVAGGPRVGDLEAGAVAAAFGDTVSVVSVVSGGLACIAGALVLARLLPGFRQQRTPEHPPERASRAGQGNSLLVTGGFGHLQQCSRLSLSTLGGGGNRTRVLQCITRASPGAACCAFLSPGDHASKTPTGSAAVRCPAWSRGRVRR
jgi:hypothetical protein